MSSVAASILKEQIQTLAYNPAGIQRLQLAMLSDEVEFVDPTNPVVLCLESGAVLVSAFMEKAEALTRRQYAFSAQTPEDLYVHMSDRDYAERFAIPAKTTFDILLPKDDILNKMVTDAATGIRKLVLPRNTNIEVAGVKFGLQYPIEIRQMAHGGLSVVYDTDVKSPLQDLESNAIPREFRNGPDGEMLWFSFEAHQFSVLTQTGSLNSAVDYSTDIALEDQYYYTRVFAESAAGRWEEIHTTHTDQIYDITKPTAVLKVTEGRVNVRIPQIYTSTGLLNRTIRIDVYQTKGQISMDLSNYPVSAYTIVWDAYDKADQTVFTAPLKTFRAVIPYSNRVVVGGRDALSFSALRERVIKNAIGSPTLPITNVQLQSALESNGYEIVKNVDNVTNRKFLATKPMPVPDDEKLITAAAASIGTVALTMAQAVELTSVIDNGSSVTITPDTLFRTVGGVTKTVPSEQITALLALPVDQRAAQVTSGSYLYTPFHYVLDMTQDEFKSRAYYLDAPEAETKIFVSENDTTLLQVTTSVYGVVRSVNGYVLQIVTESSDAWRALPDADVYVQLAFVPNGEKDRAYLLGVQSGKTQSGERIYDFDLSTTFNVDSNHGLELTKFTMYSEEPRIVKAPLTTDFELLYSVGNVQGLQWQPDSIDEALGRWQLPVRIAGVAHEKVRVRFGESLDTLWTRARSVVSSVPYRLHEIDVPRYYEKDVYARDANGAAFSISAEGELVQTILHHRGDPVLEEDGTPVLQWRKGDVELDSSGNPVPTNPRGMVRQIDVMLIEGAYWFATDAAAINYRNKTVRTVVDWLTTDLRRMGAQLIEQTHVYFYPKTTLGTVSVMILNGITTTIEAGQAFEVTLYVSADVYANAPLRAQLQLATIRTISEQLRSTTVATSSILRALLTAYGGDVIDVQVSGLGGEDNLSALTMLDEGERCSIRKRLIAQADDSLVVQEDLVFNFVRHEIDPT